MASAVCRLLGMSGGRRRMRATFWLLDAPDSLAEQSRRNPDGYGLATFDEHETPDIAKRPAADEDPGWRMLEPEELVHVDIDLTRRRERCWTSRPLTC